MRFGLFFPRQSDLAASMFADTAAKRAQLVYLVRFFRNQEHTHQKTLVFG